eukprot:889321_1
MSLGHGKPVDWWALGILLYELCVGIPPFYSTNVNEMYRKIQEAPLLFPPNLSNNCKDIITKLLERNPKKRLGSGKGSFNDIQKHPFFNNINWNKLYNREINAPYKPNVKGNDKSVPQCFDDIFLNETPKDTPAVAPTLKVNDKHDGKPFVGFSYKPQNGTHM